jgi:hypothetical protein
MKPIVLILSLSWQLCCAGQGVMIMNVSRVGKSVQQTQPLLLSHSPQAIAPTKVTLELAEGLILGAVLEYPTNITKGMVRDSVNVNFLDKEKKFQSDKVYAWRDKDQNVSMLVADDGKIVTLIVRSIDEEVLKKTTKKLDSKRGVDPKH